MKVLSVSSRRFCGILLQNYRNSGVNRHFPGFFCLPFKNMIEINGLIFYPQTTVLAQNYTVL
ncbi:hypothetical protein NEILACOT_03146 [Neisseria lactamica ATCC 23970]|uniref:Uncharacterized protein n=1 Tax=Neisseria lactamica ATCC 23970 TaxID=546265 RepID=D0W6K8_NEILA|nr:hypothetical protein NEILACOT_03146 [Neisseria lactamica ATCC 23970]